MKWRLRFLVCLLVTLAAVTPVLAAEEGTSQQVSGNNQFACDLYVRLSSEPGNLVFSPYSVSCALAMAFAGARHRTADQMASTLRFSLPQAELHSAFESISCDLASAASGEGLDLRIANFLWGEKSVTFLSPFLSVLETEYGAPLQQVDFAAAPETARLTINKWVEEKTEGRIAGLLREGSVDPSDVLVLVNALHFRGAWATRFKERETEVATFSRRDLGRHQQHV
jgi:serpin B